MRAISVWDGSGHAMTALEQVVPLFRPSAFSHIEIMMLVWPQSDTAMWSDILEQQILSDDLHRAAAEVSAIAEFRADIVFLIVGSVDAAGQVATSLQEVLHDSPVPVSVLHAPARAAR